MKLQHRRITRILLGFLSALCQTDPREHSKIMAFERLRRKGLPVNLSSLGQEGILVWPKVVAGVYTYINLKLFVLLYWQYSYDIDHFKLQQVLARLNNTTGGVSPVELKPLVVQYEANTERSRRVIKLLGNPYMDLHWIFCVSCLILIYLTYCIYMNIILSTKFKITPPFDFYFIRVMLSEQFELTRCQRMVHEKAVRLMASSRNFLLNEISFNEEILAAREMDAITSAFCEPTTSGHREMGGGSRQQLVWGRKLAANCRRRRRRLSAIKKLDARSSFIHQLTSHLSVCSHLSALLKSRQLIPVNRGPEWVEETSRQFALVAVSNILYSAIFDFLVLHSFPSYFGYFRLESPMDLVAYLELWVLVEISVGACTLNVALLNINTSDQKKYLDWLVGRLEESMRQNDKLFALGYGPAAKPTSRAINRNLVRCLMEFEVFLAQFRPTQGSFSFAAATATSVVLVISLLIRIHKPYCHAFEFSLGIFFTSFVVASSDIFFWPITQINTTSKRLYARMISLLCQMLEFDSLARSPHAPCHPGQVSDRHLVWQLRMILTNPEQFTRQFTAYVVPSVPMTVQNLVRVHYWCVLLFLTFYKGSGQWTLIGQRLADPFGLLGGELPKVVAS